MAIKGWPYTSVSGDRKVSASDEADGYDIFVGSGVVPGYLNGLAVTKVTGAMQVAVNTGAAVLAGHRAINDSAATVSLDSNSGSGQPRIDIIVFESNENTEVRAPRFVAVKGTPAASPSPPALTQTSAVWQLPLAHVLIPAGAANLDGATLTDVREYAEGRHMHSVDELIGLTEALAAKANASHTHAISNVTNLQTTLDGKAAASHTHSISNVTGLQTALDGKEPTLASDRKRKITISSSDPSGGADGDVWIKV